MMHCFLKLNLSGICIPEIGLQVSDPRSPPHISQCPPPPPQPSDINHPFRNLLIHQSIFWSMTKGSISFVADLTLRFLSSKVFAHFTSEKCSPVRCLRLKDRKFTKGAQYPSHLIHEQQGMYTQENLLFTLFASYDQQMTLYSTQ